MANNYVDFKVTVWNRAHFDDETDMEKIKEMLEKGATSNEICEMPGYTGEWETLLDTEETLTPEKNDGIATIEVYDKEKVIFANGKTLL